MCYGISLFSLKVYVFLISNTIRVIVLTHIVLNLIFHLYFSHKTKLHSTYDGLGELWAFSNFDHFTNFMISSWFLCQGDLCFKSEFQDTFIFELKTVLSLYNHNSRKTTTRLKGLVLNLSDISLSNAFSIIINMYTCMFV